MSETTIDNLNELNDVEIGYHGEDYEPASGFAAPPPAGEYTFMRVMEQESDFSQGRAVVAKTGEPMYWTNFKVQIQGGPFDGRKAYLGANSLLRFDGKGTTVGDFIRAAKSNKRPRTFAEYERDIPTIYGPFNAVVNWEFNCRDCKLTFLKGYVNPVVPKRYEGPKPTIATTTVTTPKGQLTVAKHIQKCPGCEQEIGARLVAVRYVVPSTGSNGNGKIATVAANRPVVDMPPAEG